VLKNIPKGIQGRLCKIYRSQNARGWCKPRTYNFCGAITRFNIWNL